MMSSRLSLGAGAGGRCGVAAPAPPPPPPLAVLLVRRCGAAFSAVALLAASLVSAALVVLPAERADAQRLPSFVDNLNQPDGNPLVFSFDSAQAFTTGSARYVLRSVDIQYATINSGYDPSDATVRIHADSGGSPGGSLGTLTRPDSFPFSFSDRVLTFTSAGIDLAADTTYWLVFDVSIREEGRAKVWVRGTSSGAEDAPYSSGWSIGDGVVWRNYDSTGAWTPLTGLSLKVGIGGEARVPPRSRSEVYRQRVDYERSSEAQLQRYEAVYDEVCRGTWGGAGVTCIVVDHASADGTAVGATLVITCDAGYTCDLDIDYSGLTTYDPATAPTECLPGTTPPDTRCWTPHDPDAPVQFTPTYITPSQPPARAVITPRRPTNPVRSVSVSQRTITFKGAEVNALYVNGRIQDGTGIAYAYEPFMVPVPDISRPETFDGNTVYPHVLRYQVFTMPGGQTTTLICGTTDVEDPGVDELVFQPIFPGSDGKCRTRTSAPVLDNAERGRFYSTEYEFRGQTGLSGRVRQVTAPPPPDPVPIPGCFDTVQREVPKSTAPGSPTETVTSITGYSRCSEAEYYRYLDAEEQQIVDQYAAEELYIEQIREEEQRDEPFFICISQEEWEQTRHDLLRTGDTTPRCQLANFGD